MGGVKLTANNTGERGREANPKKKSYSYGVFTPLGTFRFGYDLQRGMLREHQVVGRNAFCKKNPSPDSASLPHDSFAAQNRRSRVDGHPVFDRGVPLAAAQGLRPRDRSRAQGYPVINPHFLADLRGFSNHNTRSVIDEKRGSDHRPGMDIDSCPAVGPLRHHSGKKGNSEQMQLVCHPLHGNGLHPGVCQQNLLHVARGGIPGQHGLHIGFEDFSNFWKTEEKGLNLGGRALTRPPLRRHALGYLFRKRLFHGTKKGCDGRAQLFSLQVILVIKTREKEVKQVLRDRRHSRFGGKLSPAKVVDGRKFRIGTNHLIRQGVMRAQGENLGETRFRGNLDGAFLLGGKAFRWLNGGVTPEVFTPATLPPPQKGKLRFGVIGSPISHSLSPLLHLAAWQSLKIPAEYFRIEVPTGALERSLPQLLQSGLVGWNCTLPHKMEMFRLAQVRDPSAVQAQSVNTVHLVEGRIHGFSTDAEGWARAIREVWPGSLPPARTLLLGCGGVGQSIARSLVPIGCTSLTLTNRDPRRSQELLRELTPLVDGRFPIRQLDWDPETIGKALAETDLLIHGTSLGLDKADPLPVPEEHLNPPLRVYDTIYRKDFTPLVRTARTRGCPAEDGLGMLLHQGALSFEIWSKKPAPLQVMRQALFGAAGRPL